MVLNLPLNNCGFLYVGKNWSMPACYIYLFSYLFKFCWKLEKQSSRIPKKPFFLLFLVVDRSRGCARVFQRPLEFKVRTLLVCLMVGSEEEPLCPCSLSSLREQQENLELLSSQLTLGFSNTQVQEALRAHMNKHEKLLMMSNQQNTDDFCFILSANFDHSAIAVTLWHWLFLDLTPKEEN